MLRFDLTEILRNPGMRQVYDINEPPYTDEDVDYVSPVTGRVAVTNTGTMLLVRGPIRTTIGLECSRCLTPLRTPIEADLEEDFDLRVVEDSRHHDKDVQIMEEDTTGVFDGKVLQLGVLIRQATLLAAPLQPLCREDCPGIPVKSAETPEGVFQNSPFGVLSKLLDGAK
ncbi:MAG: DUF177 domain-containing protein [Armatimonadota bacterium]|nr:DUF177 domain-containing protein [Armatimonadota bacterium]